MIIVLIAEISLLFLNVLFLMFYWFGVNYLWTSFENFLSMICKICLAMLLSSVSILHVSAYKFGGVSLLVYIKYSQPSLIRKPFTFLFKNPIIGQEKAKTGNILSRVTSLRAPSFGGVRTWVEGLLTQVYSTKLKLHSESSVDGDFPGSFKIFLLECRLAFRVGRDNIYKAIYNSWCPEIHYPEKISTHKTKGCQKGVKNIVKVTTLWLSPKRLSRLSAYTTKMLS